MKLKKVTIHKYKSIESDQTFSVDDTVTVLVGMNEAGKTSVLEAIAKVNYFQDDKSFKFDTTHDYPRKEKKKLDKSKVDPKAVTLVFEIDDELLKEISDDMGPNVFTEKEFTYSRKYGGAGSFSGGADKSEFLKHKLEGFQLNPATLRALEAANSSEDFSAAIKDVDGDDAKLLAKIDDVFKNPWKWPNCVWEYIAREYLDPNIPKFLYYDEYYALPSEVVIEDLVRNTSPNSDEFKTAKALFELADINTDELITADNFEDYIAELEATQALISKELFEYWSANKNLKIRFAIDKKLRRALTNKVGLPIRSLSTFLTFGSRIREPI